MSTKVPFYNRIKQAMGDQSMTPDQITEALVAAGTAPTSKNLKQYVYVALSQHPDLFERVDRGVYKVNPNPLTADIP